MLTKWRKRQNNKEKGFTLVELIIVMAILAILAGIAIPKFGNVLSDSKSKADAANRTTITNAVELYYANTGNVPAATDGNVIKTLVNDGYLKEIPKDPRSTNGATEYDIDSVTASSGNLTFTITPAR